MVVYNLVYFDEELKEWIPSLFNQEGGFLSKDLALSTKNKVQIINDDLEYRIVNVVNDKPDPIGQQIRNILNK